MRLLSTLLMWSRVTCLCFSRMGTKWVRTRKESEYFSIHSYESETDPGFRVPQNHTNEMCQDLKNHRSDIDNNISTLQLYGEFEEFQRWKNVLTPSWSWCSKSSQLCAKRLNNFLKSVFGFQSKFAILNCLCFELGAVRNKTWYLRSSLILFVN